MDEHMKQILAQVREQASKGIGVSFVSDDLIAEVRQDIAEFGADHKVYAWARLYPEYNKVFVVNYDFIAPDDPVTEDEIGDNETITIVTLGELLEQLERQNQIIQED